jgi:choline dehydrogenase-like flavoprotein
MEVSMNDFDVIVIGSGAGGGTLAHRLAPSGARILLL